MKTRKTIPVLGAVSYLNTVPLIYDLGPIRDRYQLKLDFPSRLADDLAAGEMGAALIPIAEVLASPDYWVVSDACIGCRGPVWSVKMLCRKPMQQVRTVALDEGSRTSVTLAKVLLANYWKISPQFETLPLKMDFHHSSADAMLVIGDRAMIDDPTFQEQHDLGEVWHRWTGLPFVFAAWAARPSEDLAFLDQQLSESRDRGMQRVEEIVDRFHAVYGLSSEQCHRYLTYHLNFHLDEEEREAIRHFAHLAQQLSLLPMNSAVKFYDCQIA